MRDLLDYAQEQAVEGVETIMREAKQTIIIDITEKIHKARKALAIQRSTPTLGDTCFAKMRRAKQSIRLIETRLSACLATMRHQKTIGPVAAECTRALKTKKPLADKITQAVKLAQEVQHEQKHREHAIATHKGRAQVNKYHDQNTNTKSPDALITKINENADIIIEEITGRRPNNNTESERATTNIIHLSKTWWQGPLLDELPPISNYKEWDKLINSGLATHIADARNKIRTIKHRLQCQSAKLYKKALRHHAVANDMGQLARMIKGEKNESRETLKWTTDNKGNKIPAHTLEQQFEATLKQQEKQMSPHEGKPCHFLTLLHNGNTNPTIVTGLQVEPDREFTRESIKKWKLNQSNTWYKTHYDKVKRAHDNMRDLFQITKEEDPHFDWPWYLNKETMAFSDPTIEDRFRKMLKTTPGKARHNNFTLHVLGRLPQRWANIFLERIKSA